MQSDSNRITEEELDAMENLAAIATPGKLSSEHTTEGGYGPDHRRASVRLIAGDEWLHEGAIKGLRDGDHQYIMAAWDNLPRLIAEVRRLRAELASRPKIMEGKDGKPYILMNTASRGDCAVSVGMAGDYKPDTNATTGTPKVWKGTATGEQAEEGGE